jgi:hypothetical protein
MNGAFYLKAEKLDKARECGERGDFKGSRDILAKAEKLFRVGR